MLVPAPPPAYSLAPDVGPLDAAQQAALDTCLLTLTGRMVGVVVTAAATTDTHHVIELMTSVGTMLVLERIASEAAATLDLTWAGALD